MRSSFEPHLAEQYLWKQITSTDIWRFHLEYDGTSTQGLRSVLAPDELRRADRYVTDQLRMHFIVGRAATRIILAGYLGEIGPADIVFRYGSHGKPSIAHSDTISDLRFNLAHSDGVALLAVSKNGEVGVDLEQIDNEVEIEHIAKRFFTHEECSEMMSNIGAARADRFFDLWCCKEAYLKAVGVGISGGLNRCRIVDAADGTASVITLDQPDEDLGWRIHRLQPGEGFAGALCVRM